MRPFRALSSGSWASNPARGSARARTGTNARRPVIEAAAAFANNGRNPNYRFATMTRLTLHTASTAPEASRPFVERAFANNGFLPNLIGILANSPQALETYLTVSQINARGA